MKKLLPLILVAAMLSGPLNADEGMWLPALIHKLNIKEMQDKGFKLSAEELYSINNSSLKDAVASIGGCTAEMISGEGLMLTNHHCALGDIQSHSSVDHDYLRYGFWAKSKEEELPNPNKFARFLIRAEDVTERVLADLPVDNRFDDRQKAISDIISKIEKEAVGDSHYQAQVTPLFESNKYFLFVYETFRDVRLVGTPPQSLGKFGGDTDNWMWPRHTADFAIYRVYTGPDGKPASYAKGNIPYKPRHHFPISLKGIRDGDYAMVMGYPGRTSRYKTSDEIGFIMDVTNKIRIDVREKKLEIIKKYMESSPKARIQYASKYAQSSNYYKYSIGQNQGLKNLDVIARKELQEEAFTTWAGASPERNARYGKALGMIKEAYEKVDDEIAQQYLMEALLQGPEIFVFAYRARILHNLLEKPEENRETIRKVAENMEASLTSFFKDYDAPTDQKLAATLMKLYQERVKPDYYPRFFREILSKYKGNFEKYAVRMYEGTIFSDQDKLSAFLTNPTRKVMDKDPAFRASRDIFDMLQKIGVKTGEFTSRLEEGHHLLVAGMMAMNPERRFYPDANSTMRVTYGTVGDYQPRDGVIYKETTSVRGYLEKEIPGDDEFDVPGRLKELILAKDFGRYANKNGELETCFISNNDITGGNSGSPVINGNGELIGIAFDGNWEAMSGDIVFEPEIQRTINVDIRFVLWVVDKFAGANHLIDEMTIAE